MRIYIETHGCTMNISDSEIMAGILRRAGHVIVDNPEDADIIVLNTCNVKLPTEQRMIHRAKELSSKKPLIIAGCMAKTQPEKLIKYATALLGPKSIHLIDKAISGERAEEEANLIKVSMPRVRFSGLTAIVPIAEGCLGNCSYCITRFARGRLFSYPMELIVDAVRNAALDGYKQVFLTAEDTAVYGLDRGTNIAELVKSLEGIRGIFIRLGMANPAFLKVFIDDLLKNMPENIYRFLHVPVQSGSDKVLADMRRGYKSSDFLDIVRKVRMRFGDESTIATDIIVGFPTEDDEDFERTIRLLEETKPEVINISKYGRRPGTDAAKLKDLPADIVTRRSKILTEISYEVKMERNLIHVGKDYPVLITERIGSNLFQGRTEFYRPVIIKGDLKAGDVVLARIDEAKSNYLIAGSYSAAVVG
ncbi:MAG: threonylcarbamoyladenosine tRNA methylthiotransferase [Thermoproteota archaeon]|jgi:MiaB-like tRNA modifying enzyme|uniref:tRNA-t(6)A37 methylthiotransferase n=1 Tax=Candidatus Methanodesulfokora washburnensis TaxID=2478471 RepID=A0A429GV57_9CREN|nr:tRNA (N(6)-L-threonylcarbamoyladenosine(37)-C(2))-methylthiotransferase [Candidatus Methanodesulfokores washburnensis]RSN77754.1 tRNA (N(6)-L-threonylcarbamoyladenosine(37)-C(2))-methylthiotransferase [Candidatus Methanodesulfokores washburnensis]RZN58295.1 MAG: tRNA (N(6)-L-threonylcarbamoyladenosine(37)-C(2))-methylthiotransferase [Candidatus Methanodesulfokores washburnensis]TDA41148.1 MAG: threonylcarbamoyladenosine tRNA methylthiotransferase [Candidatus Korarchaeota archaeon]